MGALQLVLLVCSFLLAHRAHSKTAEEWKSRIIYQLLTDRFSPTGPAPDQPCADLRNYCGGTFRGIEQNLDYTQGLGANAIWISPFVENMPNNYHGYAAKNIYAVNRMFGTRQDLLNLIRACHERDIWVMMDVVANHMGIAPGHPEDLSGFVPFNESWHYHAPCQIQDFMNQTEVELCRLFNLPDLNQTVPWVRRSLLDWIANITHEYGFDGYRVDTVVEVEKSFWSEFWASSGVFMLGEANNGDRTCYTGGYQGPLPSVLNFPLYWAMRRAFNERQPMTEITKSLEAQAACFSDLTVLGSFVDNHDFPRFLNLSSDTSLLANALAYVLFGEGIPIIYYGTEQEYHGGNDPYCRETLWPNYNTEAPMYKFISKLTRFRKTAHVDFTARNQRIIYADRDLLWFSRGEGAELLVALTNAGRGVRLQTTLRHLPLHDGDYVSVLDNKVHLSVRDGTALADMDNGMPQVFVKDSSLIG